MRALTLARVLLSLGIPLARVEAAPEDDAPRLARARAILAKAPLVDTHNDLPYALVLKTGGDLTHVDLAQPRPELPADLPRLRAGRVGAQYWSIFVPSETAATRSALHEALRLFDVAHRLIESRPELELARTADDVVRITHAGRIASLLGVEGGHMVESSPAVVRVFHRLGARYLTLTHFQNVPWADSATDTPRANGLTKDGEVLVRELNRAGMFVDLSHVSPDVMRDGLRVSRAPVVFSHSNARALVDHPRNVPDDVLRLLPANGGVVHVSFIREFAVPATVGWRTQVAEARRAIRQRSATEAEVGPALEAWIQAHPAPGGSVADVANAIEHIRSVAGVDHVGIGADFYDDGKMSMVAGLAGPDTYPLLFAELLRRGWTEADLLKLAGQNHLRAMRQMERVASELQRATAPGVTDGPPGP